MQSPFVALAQIAFAAIALLAIKFGAFGQSFERSQQLAIRKSTLSSQQRRGLGISCAPFLQLGKKVVGKRHITLLGIFHSKAVLWFARNTQHLILAVNAGLLEIDDLLPT